MWAFSYCVERGLLCCGAQASHCGGFSCCRARALGARASLIVACGLSSCGSWALERRFSSCGAQALALWHVGSSRTRGRTRVPCIGRRIPNHCTTREAHCQQFLKKKNRIERKVTGCFKQGNGEYCFMKLGWDIISIFYCGLQSKNLKAADVDRLLKRAFFF